MSLVFPELSATYLNRPGLHDVDEAASDSDAAFTDRSSSIQKVSHASYKYTGIKRQNYNPSIGHIRQ